MLNSSCNFDSFFFTGGGEHNKKESYIGQMVAWRDYSIFPFPVGRGIGLHIIILFTWMKT